MIVQREYLQTTLVPKATRTSSGDTSASEFDVHNYDRAVFFLNVSAVSGTNPTLDVEIQTLDPASGEYFTLVTFTQATGVTKEMKKVTDGLGRRLRVVWTIGGTNPSFTFSVGAVFKT